MLEQLIGAQLFAWLLVMARVGSAFMLLPGIGDAFVAARIRLLLALAVSLVVTPVVQPMLPGPPAEVGALAALLAGEVLVGAFLGTIARVMTSALETAGAIASLQTGLAGASVLNPALATQGTLTGVLLDMAGLVLIFVTDLHHLMILSVADSYTLFQAGAALPTGDFANMVTELASSSFRVGAQMAGPFIIVGLVFNLGLGLIARLVPQIQVFFVAMPLQVVGGIALFAITLSAALTYWLRHFEGALVGFLGAG